MNAVRIELAWLVTFVVLLALGVLQDDTAVFVLAVLGIVVSLYCIARVLAWERHERDERRRAALSREMERYQ